MKKYICRVLNRLERLSPTAVGVAATLYLAIAFSIFAVLMGGPPALPEPSQCIEIDRERRVTWYHVPTALAIDSARDACDIEASGNIDALVCPVIDGVAQYCRVRCAPRKPEPL